MRRAREPIKEPNIFLTDRCNQDCLFCSSKAEDRVQREGEIRECILSNKEAISIEGGEPTLSKDLLRWVRFARESGTGDIILCTNGAALSNKNVVRSLLREGVTLFNINFPSHIEKVFDLLTRTKGLFRRRVDGMKRLVDLAGGKRVRFTLVINSLNYMTLRGYAEFMKKDFPGIFYIEMNMIKVKGSVKKRRYLVPKLSVVAPCLSSALRFCGRSGIRCIVDGVPLCLMGGFEPCSIDVFKLVHGDHTYLGEKAKTGRCKRCSLGGICAGPRKDYLDIFGDSELTPSKADPGPMIAKLEG